jgi:transcriptional regulator with XRE-family HTH domain
MRHFQNIAKLIRKKRIAHPKGYSQSDLSNILGYKNGQFISNVERSLCNIPLKMLKKISEILSIPSDELKIAILKDHEMTLEYYLESSEVDAKVKSHAARNREGLVIDGNHGIARSEGNKPHHNTVNNDRGQYGKDFDNKKEDKKENFNYRDDHYKKSA